MTIDTTNQLYGGWAVETMMMINKLTPQIEGKAFDPGWFVLRERLETSELEMENMALEIARLTTDLVKAHSEIYELKHQQEIQ